MTDHISAFRDAMRAEGIDYRGPIHGDGKRHRIHDESDKKGRRNAWYLLHLDERPAGAFGTWRGGGVTFKWSAKGVAPLTAEEREKMRERSRKDRESAERAEAERQATAALMANRIWDAGVEAVEHPYLARKEVKAFGLRVGEWVKETPPDPHTGEIRELRFSNALLIPVRDGKLVVGLQAVFSPAVNIWGEPRDKDFVYGAKKKGCWCPIGKPGELDGVRTIGICEGYATGAAVHMATGIAVLVAFDAGNLLPVAERVRSTYPDARIVIFGDNDQWTEIAGKPRNIGLEKAALAASTVDGISVLPRFKVLEGKPTDWNDLWVNEGEDEVRRQVMSVLRPPEPEAPQPAPAAEEPAAAPATEKKKRKPKPETPLEAVDAIPDAEELWFRVLGHDREKIYLYQHEKRMVTARREHDWPETALTALAPLNWWERTFPGEKGMNRKVAVDWLQRLAYERGYFDPSMLRGRGAWRDDGRMVYHLGNKLLVDGEITDLRDFDTSNVYEQGRKLRAPSDDMLTAEEGLRIVKAAQVFHWNRPASAVLLAGWCALAPLCGALRWRPHIWITGGAGSGKSTILNEFVDLLLNGARIYAQGNSTEPGIRQALRLDALPLLFEEAEQNNDRESMRVQTILSFLRQASTDSAAQTLKGTTEGSVQAYSGITMCCMVSIQVDMKHQADMERVSVLSLRPKKRAGHDGAAAAAAWTEISAALADLRSDPDLPARLMRRSIHLLPVTLKNIEVFAQAAAERFGSQREGDQYGAMLAGAWSLVKTGVATLDDARKMIDRYDWSEFQESTEVEEYDKALNALLEARIRLPRGQEANIYELVETAANRGDGDLKREEADKVLLRHGMKLRRDRWGSPDALMIANSSREPTKLIADTPYAADLKGQLARVQHAEKHGTQRFGAISSKGVAIPLWVFLEGMEPPRAPTAPGAEDEVAW